MRRMDSELTRVYVAGIVEDFQRLQDPCADSLELGSRQLSGVGGMQEIIVEPRHDKRWPLAFGIHLNIVE